MDSIVEIVFCLYSFQKFIESSSQENNDAKTCDYEQFDMIIIVEDCENMQKPTKTI